MSARFEVGDHILIVAPVYVDAPGQAFVPAGARGTVVKAHKDIGDGTSHYTLRLPGYGRARGVHSGRLRRLTALESLSQLLDGASADGGIRAGGE